MDRHHHILLQCMICFTKRHLLTLFRTTVSIPVGFCYVRAGSPDTISASMALATASRVTPLKALL